MVGVAVSLVVSFPLVAKLGRTEILIVLTKVLARRVSGGFAWTVHHVGLAPPRAGPGLAPASLVIGAGMGFIFAPLFDVILAAGDRRRGGGPRRGC